MTTQEFSNAFDTLLNSYSSQANFGEQAAKSEIVLDEYEKSVLLTQAQDIIVKSFFERDENPTRKGFDDSTRRQVDFSSLITVKTPNKYEGTDVESYDDRGILYTLPSNVLLMLNEKIVASTDKGSKTYVVVPINYKEYDRQMSKAYNQPFKKQCWRLFQNISGVDVLSEVIPIEGVTVESYKIRYIRRPNPIVLTNLSLATQESLSIDGVTDITECELNPILHIEILNKAVELAIATRGGVQRLMERDNNNQ